MYIALPLCSQPQLKEGHSYDDGKQNGPKANLLLKDWLLFAHSVLGKQGSFKSGLTVQYEEHLVSKCCCSALALL